MLKKITFSLLSVSLLVLVFSFHHSFRSGQPPSDYSGAPNGGLCSDCHGGAGPNTGGGSVVVNGLPSNFQPGQTYPFSVTINHPTTRDRWGFEINARNENNNPVGTFTTTNPNAATISGPSEIGHKNAVFSTGTSYTYNNLSWTAPSTVANGDTKVNFYVAGNAANGNGFNSGDFIYTNTVQVVLPITLKTLDYKVVDDYTVQIDWTTGSESNSREFVIEKSDDNQHFYKAGEVSAAGNTTTDKRYSFTDSKPSYFNRPVYYRLKLVDQNGLFKYSKTFQITLKGRAMYVVSLSPNPATDFIKAEISSDRAVNSETMIVSADGRVVSRQTLPVQMGVNTYKIMLPSLQHGLYFFKLRVNERTQTLSFIAL